MAWGFLTGLMGQAVAWSNQPETVPSFVSDWAALFM